MTHPSLFIKNAIIHLEKGKPIHGNLYVHNGKISSYQPTNNGVNPIEPSTNIIDAKGKHLIPGFIDTHIHGALGSDIMDGKSDTIDIISKYLPQEGTTSFLATTITHHIEIIENALIQAGKYQNKSAQAELLGIHLEGPFIASEKAGAQRLGHILQPNLKLFKKWQSLANNRIKVVTLAPELDPSGEFIKELTAVQCIVSAGHTNAIFSEIEQAVDYGLTQVTHLSNAMNPIHHREIGPVGAAFLLPELKAEVIADEVHVSKEMLELIYQQMSSDRILLVTDAMRAKGLPDGDYDLADQTVTVKNNHARLPSGVLAGSTLSMIQAAKNMLKIKNVTLKDIIKMTASNPAQQLGIYNKKGSITIGKDADLLIVDDELNIHSTICKGSLTN